MALIDPDDDNLTRYLVQHYKFDSDRHERRLVVIAAYSKQREALKLMKKMSKELLELQAMGSADAREYICTGIKRTGDKERVTQTRLTIRKMRSGWIAQGLYREQTSGKPDYLSERHKQKP